MTSNRLRMEDRFEGVGNFVPWKAWILLILEENELWDEVVNNTTTHRIVIPYGTTDAVGLVAFNKKDIKARRIILDAIKDHVIPHILHKDRAHKMWIALTRLFQSSNENRKMVLREKLKSIRMVKGEVALTYLTRISQVRDDLAAIREAIPSDELVRTAMNGASKPLSVFVQGLVARENIPTWEILCDDFVQEEI